MSFVCTGWGTYPGACFGSVFQEQARSCVPALIVWGTLTLFAARNNLGFRGIQLYAFTKDCLDLKQNEAISTRHQCDCDCDHITRSAILVLPQTQKFAGGKIFGFEKKWFTRQNSPDSRVFRIQSFHFKFRIQNLRRHDQTGEFLFRIRPHVCKQQNQSGTKTFRIRHEYGVIPSSIYTWSYENRVGKP